MADFFFFTEPSKLNDQTAGQAFGAIDENQFRIGNMFSASADAKAFAITTGNVLVQQVDGNSSLVNIILKPEDQPDLNLPKVDYIIYKGVVKSSLISTTIVAAPSKNDLTRKIWESHATLLAEMPDAPPEPLASDALGFGYSATATDDFKALETDGLNVAFYNSENTLFRVNAGDYIGDFKASSFGVMVVLEKIGFAPTFKLARELDSTISFTTLDPAATNAEKFRRKHDKEEVLSFMDSAAFFGTFDGKGIKVTSDGTNFVRKDSEDFFQEITAKHANKNTLYLDIRNEYLDSYNYYENYANEFKWDLVGEGLYSEIDYYRSKWPWMTVVDSEFDAVNVEKTIGLGLNIGDNEFPRFFLKRGEIFDINLEKSNNPSLRFMNLEIDDNENHYRLTDKIQVPKNDIGQIKANYFQLRYIKRYATPDSSYQGLSLKKESYLDNLFPIFDMKLPYINSGSVDLKMFTDVSFVDKTNINEIEFTVDLGITKDQEAISFVALPKVHNEDTLNTRDKVPLYSEQTFNGDTFIDHFNKKTSVDSIRSDVFQTAGESYEYLAFANTLDEVVLLDPDSATIEDDIKVENSILDYDFENINILSLTNAEYAQMETLKNSEFAAPYRVYLGVANTEFLTENDDSFSTTYYALRGLRETDTGDLETHEVVTDIKLLTSDNLYNWDRDVETGKVLEAYWVDNNNMPTNKLDSDPNNHIARILIKTENAIGKTFQFRLHKSNLLADDVQDDPYVDIITSNEQTFSFELSPFATVLRDIVSKDLIEEFYFSVKIGTGKFKEYADSSEKRLIVHSVRFVPNVMQALGWANALKAQNLWFSSNAEDTEDVNVELEFVAMDWILSYSRANDDYQEIITTIWNDSDNYDSLRQEINDMIAFSNSSGNPTIAELPTVEGETKAFGNFSLTILSGETLPLIEKFYYKSVQYDYSILFDPLDDLNGTLANFNFRIAAQGFLSLESGIVYINVNKIGVYVRDSFDFTDEGMGSQNLGYWNLSEKTVSKTPGSDYILIENIDYRNWRELHGKGGDFRIYSDVKEEIVNLKTTL
ncbi:MAG: DUF6402 family protein [Saonia sp.]